MCGCCCDGKVRGNDDPGDQKGLLSSPVRHRACTDIVFLLVFTVFCCGMVFVGVFSVTKGDAFRLVYGTDSYGNTCDEDNSDRAIAGVPFSGQNLKGRPFVFFMDVEDPDLSLTVCVNQCPEKQLNTREDVFRFSEQTGSLLCRYDLEPVHYFAANNSQAGPCPRLPVYQSQPLLNRCIPVELRSFPKWMSTNIIAFLNKADIFQKVLGDLYASWQELIALCFVALGFSILMVLFIRFLAPVIVWIIVAAVVISSMVATAFLWWTYVGFKSTLDSQEALSVPLLEVDINSEIAFLTFAVIASCLTLMLLAVLVATMRRLGLVTSLFREAGRCVSSIPLMVFQPALTFLLLLLLFVYWLVVLAFLCSAEKASVDGLGRVRYTEHELVTYFWWFHVAGLLWLSQVIVSCQQFVVSSAVAQWYFTKNKRRLRLPLLRAAGRLVVFHMGSVALGALVLTAVRLPAALLCFLHKKLKTADNRCAHFCVKCCCCCLYCVEKCLKYLSANAYIVIAVSGRNFCSSSRKAFHMMAGSALRVAALNSVSDLLLFLAKIAVMAASGAVSLIWLKGRSDLHFFAIPVLLVCVFAYFVAHCFLSLYEMVMDALLLCFCEDCDLNDGSPDRPYFASKRLMTFVNESSKALDKLSRKRETTAETEPAPV